MHKGAMKWVAMITWLVTGLAALNLGLAPFGFDFFRTNFMLNNMQLAAPLCYFILVCAVVSLGMMVMHLTGGCGGCGKSSCKSC